MEDDDDPDEVCYNNMFSLKTGEWVGNFYKSENDVKHFSEDSFILWSQKEFSDVYMSFYQNNLVSCFELNGKTHWIEDHRLQLFEKEI